MTRLTRDIGRMGGLDDLTEIRERFGEIAAMATVMAIAFACVVASAIAVMASAMF